MPIPVESPPAIVSPTRGDSFFDYQREKFQRPRVHRERGFGAERLRGSGHVDKARLPRKDRQLEVRFPRERGNHGSSQRDGREIRDTELRPAADYLGEITESLGGENYSLIFGEQIRAFGECIQNLTEGAKANDSLLNGMSRLDFNGKGLEALRPLTEGLSKRQLRDLRKDSQRLSQLIFSDGQVQWDKFEQGFRDWFEQNRGNLAKGLLVIVGMTGTIAGANELRKHPKVRRGVTLAILTLTTACMLASSTLAAGSPSAQPSETATTQPLETPIPPPPETPAPTVTATPDLGLVGVATPTPDNVGRGTPIPPDFPPSPWLPPSLEQARAGVGGPFPADYGETVRVMTEIVLEQVPGAREAGAAWNNGFGDNFHSVFWAKAGNGNYLWETGGESQAFNEYSMHWNEYQNGLMPEQTFAEVPDSKDAVVGFTGPSAGGLGEKPVLMKKPVLLTNGSQGFLEYFDFQTGEWRFNAGILQALLTDQSLIVWQDEDSGQFIAGKTLENGQNQAWQRFDPDKKAWVEAVTPLPPPPSEFLAQIPADKQYEIVNGQVIVDSQVWFAINDSGEWEKIQRTITFNLEGGSTMEMFEFDTLEETFQYIVVTDGATWLETFDPRWDGKTPEDIAFWERIRTIPEYKPGMGMSIGLHPESSSKSILFFSIISVGDGAMIIYRGDEGMLEAIMLNENIAIVKDKVLKGEYVLPPRPQP